MSHVDFKKALCHPVKFKIWSCRPVEFKKHPCPMSLSLLCLKLHVTYRPEMPHVALSILVVYGHGEGGGGSVDSGSTSSL